MWGRVIVKMCVWGGTKVFVRVWMQYGYVWRLGSARRVHR